jgi:hypothetical protein
VFEAVAVGEYERADSVNALVWFIECEQAQSASRVVGHEDNVAEVEFF